MTLQVSSWFVEQSQRSLGAPRRLFLLDGRDYSDYVLRWPSVRFKADTINLGTTNLTLSNIERAFTFFVNSPGSLTTSCELALGYTHPESGEERLSLYLGQPSHVRFSAEGTEVRLQLQGKTQRLTDLAIGSEVESGAVDFTGSAHLAADLAWVLVTCYGGMSAVASTSNPDIDHAQWAAWRELNELRDERVQAYLTGEKAYRVLNDLAAMHSMAITFQGARLRFQPVYDAVSETPVAFPMHRATGLRMGLDPSGLVNAMEVEADYDPGQQRFATSHVKVNSESVMRYGRRATRFGKTAVWFDGVEDARYLADDATRFRGAPVPTLSLTTPLAGGVYRQVGDVVSITDSFYGLEAVPFRITQLAIDLERGSLDFAMEQALRRPWQREAEVSSETLLVREIERLGNEDAWLGVDEVIAGPRLLRTDSAGVFQPTGLYATAVLPIDGSEVILGGPATSGGTQSVMQRSSDGGQTATAVHSMADGIDWVYDLFEVRSGTYLASTTSGGILRSTDAGSSWNLTWSVSGDYYVGRFCSPASGRLWAGTANHDFAALGLYIWESTDDGLSWALKHTVETSDTWRTHGFHTITESEHLLATTQPAISGVRVYRSLQTSVNSIAWTVVLSHVAFTQVLATGSGDLLFGFDQWLTTDGGAIYRSTDQGSSWYEDARPAKRGNVKLVARGADAADAFVSRTGPTARTLRFRNYDITERV